MIFDQKSKAYLDNVLLEISYLCDDILPKILSVFKIAIRQKFSKLLLFDLFLDDSFVKFLFPDVQKLCRTLSFKPRFLKSACSQGWRSILPRWGSSVKETNSLCLCCSPLILFSTSVQQSTLSR